MLCKKNTQMEYGSLFYDAVRFWRSKTKKNIVDLETTDGGVVLDMRQFPEYDY